MKLYYLPGACSLATHISLLEAGQTVEAIAVDRATKRAGGMDFNAINPKGYVPALVLDNGEVLTESVAVLAYVATLNPAAKLAPPAGTVGYFRVLEWLAYLSSEIHKNFSPLFRLETTEAAKTAGRAMLLKRLEFIDVSLGEKPYLTGSDFTVADAYLYVTLSWHSRVGVDLSNLARVTALYERARLRPAVQAARRAEGLPA